MQKKVFVKNGVNVRTKTFGSQSGDIFLPAENSGRTRNVNEQDMAGWCISLADTKSGQTYQLKFLIKMIIGRDPDQSGIKLCLPMDGMISKNHAMIISSDRGLLLADNQSKNHTYLNGKMVERLVLLHVGDVIRVGHTDLRVKSISQGGA